MGVDAISGVNSYTITLTNLTEFSRYRIQLTAATVIGPSERTTPMFVETDPDSASPPQFVFVTTLNSTAVQLSWGYPTTPRGNISGYIIRHNATTNGSFEMINITLSVLNDQSDQFYLFEGLRPDTSYSFQVAAYSFSNDFEQLHMGLYNDPPAVNRTNEAGKCKTYDSECMPLRNMSESETATRKGEEGEGGRRVHVLNNVLHAYKHTELEVWGIFLPPERVLK